MLENLLLIGAILVVVYFIWYMMFREDTSVIDESELEYYDESEAPQDEATIVSDFEENSNFEENDLITNIGGTSAEDKNIEIEENKHV